MKEKVIGKENNGIQIKLYGSGEMDIQEFQDFLKDNVYQEVNLTKGETKELKKFLDENLK